MKARFGQAVYDILELYVRVQKVWSSEGDYVQIHVFISMVELVAWQPHSRIYRIAYPSLCARSQIRGFIAKPIEAAQKKSENIEAQAAHRSVAE